jgi:hypothetical protein
MRAGVIDRASGVRPSKPLVVRGGLVRTFGSLAGFLVVTFLCCGIYLLEDALANPLGAGGGALISSAFIITLAAMLLFFLVKPRKGPRTKRRVHALPTAGSVEVPLFDTAAGSVRQHHLRNNLAYQRFYVDHSCIRP